MNISALISNWEILLPGIPKAVDVPGRGAGVDASRAGRPREAKNVATFFAYEQKMSFGGFVHQSRLSRLDTARVEGAHLVEGLQVVAGAVEV